MFCQFCNREVDPVMHVIKCPHCGGEAHEVEDHRYECAGCGRKFSQILQILTEKSKGEMEDKQAEKDQPPISNKEKNIHKKV